MFERVRARMQRLALRNAPAVHRVEIRPVEDGAQELRLRYSFRTRGGRRRLLTLADATGSPIVTRRIVLEGEEATRVQGGWSVPTPASPERSHFDVFASWEDGAVPLQFPAGFPRALRDISEPVDVLRLSVDGMAQDALITGVTDDPSQEGWTACTATRAGATSTQSAEVGGLTCKFTGSGWEASTRRSAASALIARAMSRVERQFELAPSATIGVAFGDRHAALLSPSASTVLLESSWVESPSVELEAEAFSAWQLTALWWGGTARVDGTNATKLMLALRLHVLACAGRREDSRTTTRTLSDVIDQELQALSATCESASDRDWYRHVVELARRIREWGECEPSNQTALRDLHQDLRGKEVDTGWIAKRLGSLGLKLPL